MTTLRDTHGAPAPHEVARLLPEILDDLKLLLPTHPAVAYIEELQRRAEALNVELDSLNELVGTMARANRNNNYNYVGTDDVLGSRLLPDLDKLAAEGPRVSLGVAYATADAAVRTFIRVSDGYYKPQQPTKLRWDAGVFSWGDEGSSKFGPNGVSAQGWPRTRASQAYDAPHVATPAAYATWLVEAHWRGLVVLDAEYVQERAKVARDYVLRTFGEDALTALDGHIATRLDERDTKLDPLPGDRLVGEGATHDIRDRRGGHLYCRRSDTQDVHIYQLQDVLDRLGSGEWSNTPWSERSDIPKGDAAS